MILVVGAERPEGGGPMTTMTLRAWRKEYAAAMFLLATASAARGAFSGLALVRWARM